MYSVKLQNFEGPFSVLLKMLDEKKLDIKDVSLVAVTGQFLEYIEEARQIDMRDLANFLSIAAQLLLLKSKAILPSLEITKEEDEDIKNLEENLERFKQVRVFAEKLKGLDRRGEMFSRKISKSALPKSGDVCIPKNLTVEKLRIVFAEIAAECERRKEAEKQVLPQEKVSEIISITDKIKSLKSLLESGQKGRFRGFVKNKPAAEVIVSFLALLELIKQNIIYVCQEEAFGEITIEKSGI